MPGDRLQRRQGTAPQGEGVPAGGGGGGRGAPPGHPAAGRPAAGPRRAGLSPRAPPPPPPQSREGAEEALGRRLLCAVGGRCRGGHAGAPRRPGLSGAVEGPAPPARDWPRHPVSPTDPHHLLLVPPATATSVSSPATRCSGAGVGAGAGPRPRQGGVAGTVPGAGACAHTRWSPSSPAPGGRAPRCLLPPTVPRAATRPSFACPVEAPPARGTLPALPHALQNRLFP